MGVKSFEICDSYRHFLSHEVNEGKLARSLESPLVKKMLTITYSDIDIVIVNNYYPPHCPMCQHFFRSRAIPQCFFNRDT